MRPNLEINWIIADADLSGGAKSNRLIAEAMARRGHRITIAYPEYYTPWPSPLRFRTFARRAHYEFTKRCTGGHHLQSSTVRLLKVKGASRVEAQNVPDADVTIGTWWETMEWINDWPASKGVKAHFIRHYESLLWTQDPQRVDATYRQGHLKLVIARWLKTLMADRFGDDQSVLVPNGIDWTQFDSSPRGKGVTPTVGFTYGEPKWKDPGTALLALRIAQKTLPDLRAIAFGTKRISPSQVLPKNFQYHLRPPQAQIPELYKSAACWLLPSTSEGFGMPGLEAAACRCPVIATRCGGPEDYVVDGVTGFLVDVGDADAMANRIIDILARHDASWQAMSDASYNMARNFDWDKSAEILEAALMAAIDNQRRL